MDPVLEAKYKEKLFTQVRPNSTPGSFLVSVCLACVSLGISSIVLVA